MQKHWKKVATGLLALLLILAACEREVEPPEAADTGSTTSETEAEVPEAEEEEEIEEEASSEEASSSISSSSTTGSSASVSEVVEPVSAGSGCSTSRSQAARSSNMVSKPIATFFQCFCISISPSFRFFFIINNEKVVEHYL